MNIAYIIENKKGKFKTFIGNPVESPGDNDSFMNVVASGPAFDLLKDAQNFINKNKKGIDKISLKPVKSSPMGTWLSELVLEE